MKSGLDTISICTLSLFARQYAIPVINRVFSAIFAGLPVL